MRVVAAMDKFRGTATAAEAAAAVGHAGWELGHDVDEVPMSDGGEGLLDVLGGPNRTSVVTGPLGAPVEAVVADRPPHRRHRDGQGERPVARRRRGAATTRSRASTAGTGQLIDRALAEGARRVIVGLGGSATTDGGLGAVDALHGSPARFRSVELEVACDVRTRFVDAAAVFAPQKGASPAQVGMLTARLSQLAQRYRDELGVDVTELVGGGAAGGLAGGLAALGGRIVPGFELVAEHVDLPEPDRRRRRRRDGRGLPRRPEPRRQGRRRRVRARRRTQGTPVVVIAGDADADVVADPRRTRRQRRVTRRPLRRRAARSTNRAGASSTPRWKRCALR